MSTDDHIRDALRTVADDISDTSDGEMWATISTVASATPSTNGRWTRPLVLVAASVAVLAAVVGVAVARSDGDDVDSDLDVIDGPTTTMIEEPTTTVDSAPPSSVPDQDDPVVGPDSRPMVVVSRSGGRVTVYFSDGRDPIDFLPEEPVRHAEVSPDGTLWVTTSGGCVECGLTVDSTLLNLDPTSGEPLETIRGAGFASVSPDGTQLAYAQLDPNAVVIAPLVGAGTNPDLGRVLAAHDPDGPAEDFLWALGQIQWSPDGSRILVQEFWEDDSTWLVELGTDDYVRDGINLHLRGADWISDDRLLGTQYCCYAEPEQEARHLVEVDLSGDEPVFIDRDEPSAGIVGVRPGGQDDAVHVVGDSSDEMGPLVRIATGETIAEDVVSIQW